MSTIFQKYAAALLPFFIIVVGGTQAVFGARQVDWSAIVQFALLVLGAVATYIVPLLPNLRWQGVLKTGVQILVVILTALVPFILPSGFDPTVAVQLVVIAVLNALATELGVQIRKQPAVSGGVVTDPTSVPKHLAG